METIIKPKKEIILDFTEWWHYRELLYIFVWRDIKVRYKQTLLGIGWALFQPLITMMIFSVFFGKLAKIPSGGLPYPLFVYTGLVIWTFFSNALVNASASLISYESMIKKVYFPRLFLPLSAVLTAAVDFGVMFLFLIVMVVYFGYLPSLAAVWIFPLLLLILFLLTAGLGLFTAAFNVRFRDVRFILPFFIQLGLFVSPVIYPIAVIFDWRKTVLFLNPLAAVIETMRSLISSTPPDWLLIGVGFFVAVFIFLVGLAYFSKTEGYFADIA